MQRDPSKDLTVLWKWINLDPSNILYVGRVYTREKTYNDNLGNIIGANNISMFLSYFLLNVFCRLNLICFLVSKHAFFFLFFLKFNISSKNPTYRKHQLSRCVRIVEPMLWHPAFWQLSALLALFSHSFEFFLGQ